MVLDCSSRRKLTCHCRQENKMRRSARPGVCVQYVCHFHSHSLSCEEGHAGCQRKTGEHLPEKGNGNCRGKSPVCTLTCNALFQAPSTSRLNHDVISQLSFKFSSPSLSVPFYMGYQITAPTLVVILPFSSAKILQANRIRSQSLIWT